MKTLAIFCFTLISLSIFGGKPAIAQSAHPVDIGFRGGLDLGNDGFLPELAAKVTKSLRTGVAFGGFAEYGISEECALMGEVLYTQQGTRITGGGFDAMLRFTNLVIPFSLKRRFIPENSPVMPYIFGGASISFLMTAEAVSSSAGVDIKDATESFDFGLHLGGGVEVHATPKLTFSLDGRYSVGLNDLDKTPNSIIKAKNVDILAGVSVTIN